MFLLLVYTLIATATALEFRVQDFLVTGFAIVVCVVILGTVELVALWRNTSPNVFDLGFCT